MFAQVLALALLLPSQSIPDRPRETWAFRSVLDNRARILTLALHKDLWIAYDATNCGLYRAWTGGVKFDGAVYTTVHGPQPTSMGTVHLLGMLDAPVWQIERSGKRLDARAEFKGYRLDRAGHVTLQYRFRMPGQRVVWVYEQPEAFQAGAEGIRLERGFRISGLARGERIGLDLYMPEPTESASYHTDGRFEARPAQAGTEKVFVPGTLWLNSTSTRLATTFRAITGSEESQRAHGPAAAAENPEEPGSQQTPREPGASLRVYWIGADMERIPKLMGGQTPNYSVVIPKIDLDGAATFGMEGDQFYAKVSGYLNVWREGEYVFRLTSDDGSRLTIRDEVVLDHDGLHGPDPKDGTYRLAAGEHPFEIEFFEQAGGEVLKLEWKVPGSETFEVVPPSALTTPEGEVRVTSPGKKTLFDPLKRWRPGDGIPLAGVHPSFDLETVRPKDFQPRVGGMDFLPDGRLVVCTWDPEGAVYLLDGVRAPKPHDITVKRIAAGLAEPLGLRVVDGTIYVLQKQELTRLRDLDGDDVIDEYFAVANGWGVTSNFHEFAFGLLYDKGYFYANLATAIDPGGRSTRPQNPDRGMVVKISKDGDFSFPASGLRTPNGIGFGYNGEIFITDNQGDWLPSSKLLHFRDGGFFGNRSVDPIGKRFAKEDPPVVWLPQGEIGNSPSQCAPLNVGPFRNQMIHGDVTHGGVKRVFVEAVEGVLQGCAFRFTQGLEAGINRLAWGPDRALYVGGIGSTGNWGQEGKERFGLQRLAYNGKAAFEMLAVRAKSNGMELEFTKPLQKGKGESPGDYSVRTWRYEPTEEYGGPKLAEKNSPARSVAVRTGRRKVFLEIPGLKEGTVVYFKVNRGLAGAKGEELWSTEAWYTLNRIPKDSHGKPGPVREPNKLSPAEGKEGFELLFDGKDLAHWRGFKKQDPPFGWQVANGELRIEPRFAPGDLNTREQIGDIELRIEWKMSPGANSGIIYRSSEDRESTFETGPEYQLMDDDLNPASKNPLISVAANYALHPRTRDTARPSGTWNEARIIAKGDHVEHWLNGYKVVEYRLHTDEWRKLVAASKFGAMPGYGMNRAGHIALQDHGDVVWFRNIRIRRL